MAGQSIVIRHGTPEDYAGFLLAEEKAWGDAGVELITQDQFNGWLEIFPEGLLLAEYKGEICGHLFSQICDFDPNDESDNRSWDELTDFGSCRSTHNPHGNTLYTVSVSACMPGAGKRFLRQALADTRKMNLKYYAGASSLPGVQKYATEHGQPMDRSLLEQYMAAVLRKLKLRDDPGDVLTDPVVSVTLGVHGARYYRLLKNYFDYPKSGNWAALIAYVNPEYAAS